MNRLRKLGESIRAVSLPGVRPGGWWTATLLLEPLLPATTVWLTRQTASGWNSEGASLWLVLLAGAIGFGELLRAVRASLGVRQSSAIRDAVTSAVHAKSMRVGLAFYDDAAFHERLHAARVQAPDQAIALVEGTGSAVQSLIALGMLAGMLLTVSGWLPLLLAAAMLPLLMARLRGSLRLHEWRRRVQDSERHAWYLDYLLTCAEPAAELRQFGWGSRMRGRYDELRQDLRRSEWAVHRRNTIEQCVAFAIAAVICGGAWPLLHGASPDLPGALAVAQACYYGFTLTQPLVASLGTVYSSLLLLGGFGEFLRLPEPQPLAGKAKPLRDGIRFRNVSFRYSGSSRFVLDGFSLFLPAGRITAITGVNGSGKSTLAKLLCGLYRPTSGTIEFDGEPGPAPGAVSAMFQQPVRYQDTLAANVAPASPAPPAGQVLAAAHRAGLDAKVDEWPDPVDQALGNQFPGGIELSGGEWQKVALARALYPDTPVLVLDEPTSMMDPAAESEFLAALRRQAYGRTIVIITHRRAAVDAADHIVEMEIEGTKALSAVN